MIGSAVRDIRPGSVRDGRILNMNAEGIHVDWSTGGYEWSPTSVISYEDSCLEWAIEILTFDQGWVPVRRVLGATAQYSRTNESTDLTETEHDPFKSKNTNGPGPRGRVVSKRKKFRWSCKCKDYVCVCKTGGNQHRKAKTKIVKIDPEYKKTYNADYADHKTKK